MTMLLGVSQDQGKVLYECCGRMRHSKPWPAQEFPCQLHFWASFPALSAYWFVSYLWRALIWPQQTLRGFSLHNIWRGERCECDPEVWNVWQVFSAGGGWEVRFPDKWHNLRHNLLKCWINCMNYLKHHFISVHLSPRSPFFVPVNSKYRQNIEGELIIWMIANERSACL